MPGWNSTPAKASFARSPIARSTPVILTGDKRAIAAAEALLETVAELAALTERIACLEQAITLAVERLGALPVRALVLAELGMDTAINICFQFTNPAVDATFEPSGFVELHQQRARQRADAVDPGRQVGPAVSCVGTPRTGRSGWRAT